MQKTIARGFTSCEGFFSVFNALLESEKVECIIFSFFSFFSIFSFFSFFSLLKEDCDWPVLKLIVAGYKKKLKKLKKLKTCRFSSFSNRQNDCFEKSRIFSFPFQNPPLDTTLSQSLSARGDADVGYGLFQAVLGIGSLNNAVKSATLPL